MSGPAPRRRPEVGDRCYLTKGCTGEFIWTPLANDRSHEILHCNECSEKISERVISEESTVAESDNELFSALDDVSMSEEEQEELNWRIEELDRAGYGHDAAVTLAFDKTVDLHEAVDLLKRDGKRTSCTEELALQILL